MKVAKAGIKIHILGDSSPFSKSGKSIGYLVWPGANNHDTLKDRPRYFIDCGAPIFELIEQIRPNDYFIITHAHEDHKRWLTDLAFYQRYFASRRGKVKLATTETIHQDCYHASKLALEQGLSPDAKRIIDIPYETYVNPIVLGPKSKYRITQVRTGRDSFTWRVVDSNGRIVRASKAKVFMTPRRFGGTLITSLPRLLYKDDQTGEWVEPETYYAFSENNFYQKAQNYLPDKKSGLIIKPLKSIAWHGPPTIGLEITSLDSKVIFSSDTVYHPELWARLAEEHHPRRSRLSKKAFEKSFIIYDDINRYIERVWSPRRYAEAINAYKGAVVIHDTADRTSRVHTTYEQISRCQTPEGLILTHCPDKFVSEFPLAISGKTFRIVNNTPREIVDGQSYSLNADVYYKDYPDYYVGYQSRQGRFSVINDRGDLVIKKKLSKKDRVMMRVELYQDIQGKYLPYLGDKNNSKTSYRLRPDKKIERVSYQRRKSRGTLVKNLRTKLGHAIPKT